MDDYEYHMHEEYTFCIDIKILYENAKPCIEGSQWSSYNCLSLSVAKQKVFQIRQIRFFLKEPIVETWHIYLLYTYLKDYKVSATTTLKGKNSWSRRLFFEYMKDINKKQKFAVDVIIQTHHRQYYH